MVLVEKTISVSLKPISAIYSLSQATTIMDNLAANIIYYGLTNYSSPSYDDVFTWT